MPGVPGRLRLRAPFDGEAAIDAIGREEEEEEGAEAGERKSSSSSPPPNPPAYFEALRQGLLSLRQNVCLIEDPDLFDDGGGGGEGEEGDSSSSAAPPLSSEASSQAKAKSSSSSSSSSPPAPRHPNARPLLHPRFNLTSTTSFRELGPQGWRDALAGLHDDYYYGKNFFNIFFFCFSSVDGKNFEEK